MRDQLTCAPRPTCRSGGNELSRERPDQCGLSPDGSAGGTFQSFWKPLEMVLRKRGDAHLGCRPRAREVMCLANPSQVTQNVACAAVKDVRILVTYCIALPGRRMPLVDPFGLGMGRPRLADFPSERRCEDRREQHGDHYAADAF